MKQENSSFVCFDNSIVGLIFDDSKHDQYPIKYYNVVNGNGCKMVNGKNYFGYVYDGEAIVNDGIGNPVVLSKGMFFSISGDATIEQVDGKIVIIELQDDGYYKQQNYKAYRMFGGPIEERGRLKYIDGCTDSLLLCPIKKGDPCLNHLHFPSGIDQTQHTHPSHRIGIVASGSGECITPFGKLPLTEGMIFVIKEWNGKDYSIGLDGKTYPNGQHAFKTFSGTMDVIAFHPDSDFGAEDDFHPMINRTIVDGVSANTLTEIQTKDVR